MTQDFIFPEIDNASVVNAAAYCWYFKGGRRDGKSGARKSKRRLKPTICASTTQSSILRRFQPEVNLVIDLAVQEWMRFQHDRTKFQSLVKAWRSERSAASWVTDMATCPAYQGIIAMGPGAIPLILAQLESEGDEPDHWFWALRALTDADPVREEDRGDIVKMAAAWVGWGRAQGYAW